MPAGGSGGQGAGVGGADVFGDGLLKGRRPGAGGDPAGVEGVDDALDVVVLDSGDGEGQELIAAHDGRSLLD